MRPRSVVHMESDMKIELGDFVFYQNPENFYVIVFRGGRAVLHASCNGPLEEQDFLELLHFIQRRGAR